MLTYLRTDLFSSPAQTLVNTVNTEGVMGKGVAKTFKKLYPDMFRAYAEHCRRGELRVGSLMLWRSPEKWVLNFPTKTTWRQPARLEYIEAGLRRFVELYEDLGLTSVSFPALGCGNGNLDWRDVKPLMEHHLTNVQIPVYVHDCQVAPDFVPEHLERRSGTRPWTLDGLLADLARLTSESPVFNTFEPAGTFQAKVSSSGDIEVSTPTEDLRIPAEEVHSAWSALERGLLTTDLSANERSRKYQRYLLAVLAALPYVLQAEAEPVRMDENTPRRALFFRPASAPSASFVASREKQLALWR